jgi:hypothetical protein
MTGPAINDYIIKALSGTGIRTDEMQSLREDYVSRMRDGARGTIINQAYLMNGKVAPIYYQETYASSEDWIQEDKCVYKFPAPSPLTNPEGLPYVEWIGGSDWSCDGRFRFAQSRAALVMANSHHIVGRSSLTRAFYDNNNNLWWIYRAEDVSDFAVRQVCNNPYEVKEYNIDSSEYPFPTDQLDRLMEEIFKLYYRSRENARTDLVPNSREDSKINIGGRR